MAQGQLTYLQLVNRVLQRLGKAQAVSASFASYATDSWPGIVKDFINDAQRELAKEHDWSSLFTTDTFSVSASRTHDLSGSTTDFQRELSLVDTTNERVLEPASSLKMLEFYDPGNDDAGAPTHYHIAYPTLTFNRVATISCRLRYLTRPTVLSASTDVSTLPEQCDMALVWWAVWQLAASREDSTDGGEGAKAIYQETLARAIGQDQRRMDRLYVLQPTIVESPAMIVPYPTNYPRGY